MRTDSSDLPQVFIRYSEKNSYCQESNRYFSRLKVLRWCTLLVLSPILLIGEIIAWGYAILKGHIHVGSKFHTYMGFSVPERWSSKPDKLPKTAGVDDKIILQRFGYRLNFTQTAPTWLVLWLDRVVNPGLVLLSKLCFKLVSW